MTVMLPHGYKLQGFMKDGEPWIRTVPTEDGEDCYHCEQVEFQKNFLSGNFTISTKED